MCRLPCGGESVCIVCSSRDVTNLTVMRHSYITCVGATLAVARRGDCARRFVNNFVCRGHSRMTRYLSWCEAFVFTPHPSTFLRFAKRVDTLSRLRARSRHGSDNRLRLSFTTVSPLRYLGDPFTRSYRSHRPRAFALGENEKGEGVPHAPGFLPFLNPLLLGYAIDPSVFLQSVNTTE